MFGSSAFVDHSNFQLQGIDSRQNIGETNNHLRNVQELKAPNMRCQLTKKKNQSVSKFFNLLNPIAGKFCTVASANL